MLARRLAISLIGVVTMLASISVPAYAFDLHVFSWVTRDNQGSGYTGLKEKRKVADVTFPGACSTVYQTMWVTTTEPGSWTELGTHHSCSGITTFYGYAVTGHAFVFLDDFNGYNVVDSLHTYMIDQFTSGTWFYYVDGIPMYYSRYQDNGITAIGLKVVLETYESTAVVPTHKFYNLEKRRWQSGSTYVDWGGHDKIHVDPQYGVMCGDWLSNSVFQVAANNTC